MWAMLRSPSHLDVPVTASTASRTMAVMVTDVVESTRLRTAVGDEEATRLIIVLSNLVANAVTAHGGTVRRGTGDGNRSTFTSVRAALRAAGAVQGLLARRPVATTRGAPVTLRVGICVGEVDDEPSGDISGDPVRAAARVAACAPSGGVILCPVAASMADDTAGLEVVAKTSVGVLLEPRAASPAEILPGRGGALAEVTAALDALAQREGGVLLVAGEIGSGRSQLLSAASGAAAERGVRTLRHRCIAGAERTHGTLVGLLDDALVQVDEDTLRAAVGNDAAILCSVLPELASVVGDLGDDGRLQPDEHVVERALARFLFRAASSRPLLLLIDDFDLADTGSRDIICRLAPRLRELGVLVIASMHDTGAVGSWPAWRALSGLVRAGHAQTVPLPRLDREHAGELLGSMLRDEPPPAHVDVVLERTGGNVALIVALAKAAQRTDAPVHEVAAPDEALLPLRAFLEHLHPAGRQVLELLAVLGKPTTLALLVAFIDRPEDELLAAIEHAEQLGVLDVRDLVGQPFLWFRQGLVRELLLAETGGVARSGRSGGGDIELDLA
jgi:class 3 adenylate cyclase